MKRILECVPNFSEGTNEQVLKALSVAIQAVPDVKLLNVDPGKGANRTVFTFAGEPEAVVEAAFQAIKVAAEQIDMRKHKGTHPRIGATDVCPLVPVSGITMGETVVLAQELGERVGRELGIPVYLYENAAATPSRRLLADIRMGEYEGLPEKLRHPDWKPDYGPTDFNAQSGATVIGARDFLGAFNVNLNTTDLRLARSIAAEVRESGRTFTDTDGHTHRVPGALPSVRAIGWFIEEYGVTQVSMNLTNLHQTPLHIAFDAVDRAAQRRGLRVTGSEVIGLLPKHVLVQAGKHYLQRQGQSPDVTERQAIFIACRTLGLSDVKPFEPESRIIEYLLDRD